MAAPRKTVGRPKKSTKAVRVEEPKTEVTDTDTPVTSEDKTEEIKAVEDVKEAAEEKAPAKRSRKKVAETVEAAEEKAPAKRGRRKAAEAVEAAEEKAPAKRGRRKAAETVEAAEEKAPAKRSRKKAAELQKDVYIQFGGKSYSQEDLVKIAQDVWTFDLKKTVEELTSLELYVKPEENMVYYVMNKEYTGSFYI